MDADADAVQLKYTIHNNLFHTTGAHRPAHTDDRVGLFEYTMGQLEAGIRTMTNQSTATHTHTL